MTTNKATLLVFLFQGFFIASFGQNTKSKDTETIKKMCGCYRVDFAYSETFPADTAYKLKDNYYASAPAEWVFVAEENEDLIVLQHILVMNDTTIIKHWRQDWLYENTELFEFEKDKTWNRRALDEKSVDKTWTQKVYQVDDSPRYEGNGRWIHTNKPYWESTSDAPLPRREFTKRDDYNVMQRRNRQFISGSDWVHEQDNVKINRTADGDEILVEEKGRNTYTQIDDKHCEPGKKWWEKNATYWKIVREEWNRIFAENDKIELHSKVDDKLLYQHLFALNAGMAVVAEKKPKKVRKEVRAIIKAFLK